ncbi:hypothetical protein DQ04_02161000 [Trypanosoma grayi]|uniref:hypothetical protein n=1 Tax=Trypanosoma grayi TaxID=71804 RepID=UPI0004F44E24|nr:hypothetical protein DQ04_02161000 [Trypanosoma grayi]KEG11906.1 hypothetical protein DQ04_02161000 [Trypanosoma grayi]
MLAAVPLKSDAKSASFHASSHAGTLFISVVPQKDTTQSFVERTSFTATAIRDKVSVSRTVSLAEGAPF